MICLLLATMVHAGDAGVRRSPPLPNGVASDVRAEHRASMSCRDAKFWFAELKCGTPDAFVTCSDLSERHSFCITMDAIHGTALEPVLTHTLDAVDGIWIQVEKTRNMVHAIWVAQMVWLAAALVVVMVCMLDACCRRRW
jgi:hypothetical protein